jgi:hypothetical protein
MAELLTTREVAEIRRKSPQALVQERRRGTGPRYIVDNGRYLYPADELDAYMAANKVTPEDHDYRFADAEDADIWRRITADADATWGLVDDDVLAAIAQLGDQRMVRHTALTVLGWLIESGWSIGRSAR